MTLIPIDVYRRVALRPAEALTAAESIDLGKFSQRLAAAQKALKTRGFTASDLAQQTEILTETQLLLEAVRRGTAVSGTLLAPYLNQMRAAIEVNTAIIARRHLDRLHTAVQDFYTTLNAAERAQLRVQIFGTKAAHQGHWAVQYFAQVLGVEGEGERIHYIESPTSQSTWIVDSAVGIGLFADPDRLHRDLLADAVFAQLNQTPLRLH